MIGAIIGDIIGSRFEFNNYRHKDFELLTPDCDYTDDSICTIAVADALLRSLDFLMQYTPGVDATRTPWGAMADALLNGSLRISQVPTEVSETDLPCESPPVAISPP